MLPRSGGNKVIISWLYTAYTSSLTTLDLVGLSVGIRYILNMYIGNHDSLLVRFSQSKRYFSGLPRATALSLHSTYCMLLVGNKQLGTKGL